MLPISEKLNFSTKGTLTACLKVPKHQLVIAWCSSCWGKPWHLPCTSLFPSGKIVVETNGLHEVHDVESLKRGLQKALCYDWSSNEDNVENQHQEVEGSITRNTPLSELALLERVDRWTDLATSELLVNLFRETQSHWNIPWSKPKQHHGVSLIHEWDQERNNHEEKNKVTKQEVAGEHAEFGDLAKELTPRLRH